MYINFSNGFSVLTGQTGSGKSIIVGALNLISEQGQIFQNFTTIQRK